MLRAKVGQVSSLNAQTVCKHTIQDCGTFAAWIYDMPGNVYERRQEAGPAHRLIAPYAGRQQQQPLLIHEFGLPAAV